MISKSKKIFYFCFIFSLSCLLFAVAEAATLGETKDFYIDSSYDAADREKISASLQKISSKAYFYLENSWWEGLGFSERENIKQKINQLAEEFENKIYPTLTSTFGSEWKPGIDNDEAITVLIQRMKKGRAGYFRTNDGYFKFQATDSNEKEMVYLNSDYITSDIAKSFLAHEFVHLITFNQKERMRNVSEEVWLNEARAEYAPTLLGYDSVYEGSNLQRRVNDFVKHPSDSLTDWTNSYVDYGVLNLFTQYLVDHYGVKVLIDSLHSSLSGIPSINEALKKNGFSQDFSQIFTDWTVAVLVNDCSLGPKYCYKNADLKNLRIVPISNFLPINAQSTLYVNHLTKNWAGNWQKIFGGGGTLTFEFDGGLQGNFKVPYLLCDYLNKCEVKFLSLNKNQEGKIVINEFNTKYLFLTIIPSVQNNADSKTGYYFSWQTRVDFINQEEELISRLLAQIEALKIQIAQLKAQIAAYSGGTENGSTSCQRFDNNLYFGIKNNQEVCCLQEFLKNQGSEIYPEALVTGNFLSLTKSAVIRFQEKYASEILNPLGLNKGTGYMGVMTRTKINQLLGF